MKCKHCGREVVFTGSKTQGFDTDYVHANHIRRCLPSESGQPYGLEADVKREDRGTHTLTSEPNEGVTIKIHE